MKGFIFELKTVFKYITGIIIILGFLVFLAALYVGVDPNSSFSARLRTISGLNLILREREKPQPLQETAEKKGGRVIFRYIQSPSAKGSGRLVYDTELLLPDTDLYSAPSEEAKLDEKTTDVKRYQVIKRQNDWALIFYHGKRLWVSPKRKNLLYYNMTEEMRRIITGEGDYIDFPLWSWYDKMVDMKVQDILLQDDSFRKIDSSVGTFYCDGISCDSMDSVVTIIELLRKKYAEYFGGQIDLKPDVILPIIFLKTGKGSKAFLLGGDYTLGIIKVDNFSIYSDTSIAVLLHEYTHNLNRIVMRLGGTRTAPLWVNEGLCEYFSCITLGEYLSIPERDKKIDRKISDDGWMNVSKEGNISQGKSVISRQSFLEGKSQYSYRMYSNNEFISFEKLTNDAFWKKEGLSTDTMKLYSTAWAVISWFLDGNGGRNREGFINYLKALVDGKKNNISIFDYIEVKTARELDQKVKEEILSGKIGKY